MSSRFAIFWGVLSILFFYTAYTWGWIFSIVIFSLMIGSQFYYRRDAYSPDTLVAQFLGWTGTICMGFWATLILLSIPGDVIRFFSRFFSHSFDPKFWVLGGAIAISVFGLLSVFLGPKIRRVKIPTELKEIKGLKIAQISDLHVGSTIRRKYVEDVVCKVMELEPDLIAITGDIADGEPAQLEAGLAPLAKLQAKLGVYYVTGNHEYYWNAELWIKKARDLGFIPLINENRVVTFNGVRILVGGVTDTSAESFFPSHRSDPAKASLTGENPLYKILLAHRPDSSTEAEPAGFNLQLSGHTHAGQFFPFNLLVQRVHRFNHGLHKLGKMSIYVSAGTGYWGPPNRFGVPSEITLLTF